MPRPYCELIVGLGVRTLEWRPGRVVVSASRAPAGGDTLAALSELAMAAAYASARIGEPRVEPPELRVALIIVRTQWSAPLEATASAMRCPRSGWLLDCELRSVGRRLVSRAFSYAREHV